MSVHVQSLVMLHNPTEFNRRSAFHVFEEWGCSGRHILFHSFIYHLCCDVNISTSSPVFLFRKWNILHVIQAF
jgi:hypothetical protein